jgi:hypothetical protein
MALVCRSLHRWWVRLVSAAVMVLTPVGASPHEIGSDGKLIVSQEVASVAVSPSTARLDLDQCRSTTHARPDEHAARGTVAPTADSTRRVPCDLDGHLAAQLDASGARDSVHGRVAAVHLAGRPGLERKSSVRLGRRSRLRFDAEEWEDRVDEDDDTELPVRLSIRQMIAHIYDLTFPEGDFQSDLIDTSSPFGLSPHRLRC